MKEIAPLIVLCQRVLKDRGVDTNSELIQQLAPWMAQLPQYQGVTSCPSDQTVHFHCRHQDFTIEMEDTVVNSRFICKRSICPSNQSLCRLGCSIFRSGHGRRNFDGECHVCSAFELLPAHGEMTCSEEARRAIDSSLHKRQRTTPLPLLFGSPQPQPSPPPFPLFGSPVVQSLLFGVPQ